MPLAASTICDVRHGLGTRLEFETLIADLLIRVLDTREAQLDSEIDHAIQRVVEFLGLDQGILIQWGEDPHRLHLSHSWTIPGGHPVSPTFGRVAVPWVHQHSSAGEIVLFSRVDELPAEAEQDREFFRRVGTQSLASLPLRLHGRVVGTLIFASQSAPTRWPEEVVHRLQLIAEVFVSLLDRHQVKRELGAQLGHERLLADVSAQFVNVAGDQLDAAIENAQRLVCEHFGLDRSAIFQVTDQEPGVLLLTHLHQPPDGPPWQKKPAPNPLSSSYWTQAKTPPAAYVRLDVQTQFPWTYRRIQEGNTTVISKLDELPEEAAADKEMFCHYQTKSTVVVPLSMGGALFGCVTFATMRENRHWSEGQIRRFQFVADVFANALARGRATQTSQMSEERLQLATESAGVGLWSMQVETGQVWVTAKARDIFGFAPDEQVTEESLLGKIHPEDCSAVRQAVQQALHTGASLIIDCRIARADGSIRWIVLRGRSHFNASGQPQCLTGIVVDLTERKQTENELHRALEELKRLQDQLQQENISLREQVQIHRGAMPIVGNSDALMKVMRQAEQAATTDCTVLILGETGTGKELLAQHIHRVSRRSAKAFITTNIAAIPATLLESELFGREKGAYTGALTKEIGRFELANGGTLFLDEVGEMPMETQVKLLRVLQTGEFERLGSGRPLRVDVRVVAATNRKLPELIKAGLFRQDLFYRLNVFPITLPPLRDRPEDIPLLVWAFVKELSEKMGRAFERVRKKDLDILQNYDWPGNVRELRNVVERSMILSEGDELRLVLCDGQSPEEGRSSSSRRLVDVQKQHILRVLESTQNRIHGVGGAAEILGVKPSTLYSLLARLGIPRKR